jgi:hypothetical protein
MQPKAKLSTVRVPYLKKAKVSHVSLVTRGANQIGLEEVLIEFNDGTKKSITDFSLLDTEILCTQKEKGKILMKTWKVTAETTAELELAKTMFVGEYTETQETSEEGIVKYALEAVGTVEPLEDEVPSEIALSGTLKAYLAKDIVVQVAKEESVEEDKEETEEEVVEEVAPVSEEVVKALATVSEEVLAVQKSTEAGFAELKKTQEEFLALLTSVLELQKEATTKLETVEKSFSEKVEELEEDKASLEKQVEEGAEKLARVVEENDTFKTSPPPKETRNVAPLSSKPTLMNANYASSKLRGLL